MPIYECVIVGAEKSRLIRAKTAAQARNHLVSADTVTAERMADLMADGVTLEKADATVPTGDEEKADAGELGHEPKAKDAAK